MNGSPQTEIIGGNIYNSEIESIKAKSAYTPRATQLLGFDMAPSEEQLYWYSSQMRKDNLESSSSMQIKPKHIQREPLGEIRQPIEEDKYEAYFPNSSPSPSVWDHLSKKSKLSQKKISEFYGKCDNNSNPKGLLSDNSSEFFIKWNTGYQSDTRADKPSYWAKCSFRIRRKRPSKKLKNEMAPLTSNQKQIYQMAIRQATEENEELNDVISGLNQQINELKLELEERDTTIDELAALVNRLTDGELDQKLNC